MSDSGDGEFEGPETSTSNNLNCPRFLNDKQSKSYSDPHRQKKKRRIVMRILFDDSDENASSDASEKVQSNGVDGIHEMKPCSSSKKGSKQNSPRNKLFSSTRDQDDLCVGNEISSKNTIVNKNRNESDSSSDSEVNQRVNLREKKGIKSVIPEEKRVSPSFLKTILQNDTQQGGFESDSSNNELLEKCPICLLTFRLQEIGLPNTCNHKFCANCIEEWSKNVQTCPIDRMEFNRIIVRKTYENLKVVREIDVVKGKEFDKGTDFDTNDLDITICEVCRSQSHEEVMLLCDSCNQGYHIFCLTPPLHNIPEGSWYCANCFDSEEEVEEEEGLNFLYEDIRDMGIPETRLRVSEVYQPRILRTRQNERIRAEILRRTRARISTNAEYETTRASNCVSQAESRISNINSRPELSTRKKRNKSCKRRKVRQRTYVVEYDLDNYDKKFAKKTTKKVIRRRRKRNILRGQTTKGSKCKTNSSKRLAEQLGVAKNGLNSSFNQITNFSIFGNANNLEYFSDDGFESDIQMDTGHGIALQTSVRIANFSRNYRSRKGLLDQIDRQQSFTGTPDILSNLLDMQDRWHNATRNLGSVHIDSDGTLNFEQQAAQKMKSTTENTRNNINPNNITQAPMYPRQGNQNYNSGVGNSSRYNNQSNYRGGSGGGVGNNGNSYRNSASSEIASGSSSSGNNDRGCDGTSNFNMIGRGNFQFSNPNYNANTQNSSNFTQLNRERFHRNNNRNNRDQSNLVRTRNQSNLSDLPFQYMGVQINNNIQSLSQEDNNEDNIELVQNREDTQQISGFPSESLDCTEYKRQTASVEVNENASFSAVPNDTAPLPFMTNINPVPPLAPPPWNSTLFQLTADYGFDDDDDSNCPNFSVYSVESQQVAKSSELNMNKNDDEGPKEDDENEDLVQLDDDDEMSIQTENSNNNSIIKNSDSYDPDHPTDENHCDVNIDDNEIECQNEIADGDQKQFEKEKTYVEEEGNQENAENKTEKNLESPAENNRQVVDENKINADLNEVNIKDYNKQSCSDFSDSTSLSKIKLPDGEAKTRIHRRGVLELYDDSDWEELCVGKPDEKICDGENSIHLTGISIREKKPMEEGNIKNLQFYDDKLENADDHEDLKELDRSYTPCLDEKNDLDVQEEENMSTPVIEPLKENSLETQEASLPVNDDNENATVVSGMGTELISEDDDSKSPVICGSGSRRNNKSKISNNGRQSRDNDQFKKVSKNQKERNYRSEKQHDKERISQPRGRYGSRSHSRSCSRSNDKENHGNQRWQGVRGGYQNRRFLTNRVRRQELPRYDVRHVVGQQRNYRDPYGRNTSRPPRSRSASRTRRRRSLTRSRSRQKSNSLNRRRRSFSISPTPLPVYKRRSANRRSYSLRRSPHPARTQSPLRSSPIQRHSRSKLRLSRSISSQRINGRRTLSRIRRHNNSKIRSQSHSQTPRYTPRLNQSKSPKRRKSKSKRSKDHKKKKTKKRETSTSPVHKRILSHQLDREQNKIKINRHHTPKENTQDEHSWSPSPSPQDLNYTVESKVSWTPPLISLMERQDINLYGVQPKNQKEKRKRDKKKKKPEKRREAVRKEKRRHRSEIRESPSAPSKEVFASGNNILVSVSFNKDSNPPQQTTVVTLPPTREEVLSSKRRSKERQVRKKKDKPHRIRKKIDTKPVAIIDLERSPFQVHQEPTDVIILTDSEVGNDGENPNMSRESEAEDINHRQQEVGDCRRSSNDKTPPMERIDTIMEESYEIQQMGPKTPPEPPIVKFSLLTKKQNKVRNPLHDVSDRLSDGQEDQLCQEVESIQNSNKIGPNTPPESGPCSPDVYDPFDPTKSPSMSPRSPTPQVISQNSITENDVQSHNCDDIRGSDKRTERPSTIVTHQQDKTLNPVELVMALMNAKTNNSQETNKPIDSQFGSNIKGGLDDCDDKADDSSGMVITVLSNVLLTSGKSQHIPSISSPPISKSSQNIISKLPLLQNSGVCGPTDGSIKNDIESPYSPGSADYEDLFEPPPDKNRRSKRSRKLETFDNLFGSSSPVRLPSYLPTTKKLKPATNRQKSKTFVKVGKLSGGNNDEQVKVYDDVPNSAVELQVKDKFLRKLNRQERVVEEVKLILKPRFNKKQITKEDYKEIMRRAVPKICHSKSGEINPNKIKNLIEAYVKKFRAKHKKLNIINTGQVSSAVKCAAYLKKL